MISFDGSGVWAQVSLVLSSGSHKASTKVSGLGSDAWSVFQTHVTFGIIHCTAAIEFMEAIFSRPIGMSFSDTSLS